MVSLIEYACRRRECLWFQLDDDNEIVFLVKNIIDGEVENYGNIEAFIENVRKAIEQGLIDSIIIPVHKPFKKKVVRILTDSKTDGE